MDHHRFVRLVATLICAFALVGVLPTARAQGAKPIEATNAAGEKVLLYPDGRWEYVDPTKRAEPVLAVPAAPAVPATAPPAAATAGAPATGAAGAPPAASAPAAETGGSQGGWLFGRRVYPNDPDYNRGSLNPKTR
jgi:hypothetical protein